MKLGRIAIVGCGAIGIYYGSRLAAAGEDVTFLLRSDYDAVNREGFKIESIHGDFDLPDPEIVMASKEIGAVDLVIVAWKATSNENYESVLRPLIKEDTKILTLQNGLGNTEKLAEFFGGGRVFGGLCFVCINRVASGHVRHTASGMIRIGSYEDVDEQKSSFLLQLQERFKLAHIRCEIVSSLEEAQWKKLVWNIPFNGLAIAEGGVDTEVLLGRLELEGEIRDLMREVALIAAASGYEIPQYFIDEQVEVTRGMGAYKPSSMIDFTEGLPVEVDVLFHEPLRRAKALNIAAPKMEKLVKRIDGRICSL